MISAKDFNDVKEFDEITSEESFYDNVISEILNISDLRLVLKIINTKTFINIKTINIVLVTVTATMNAVMILLNYDDLCCDIFDDFMIKSCTSELI